MDHVDTGKNLSYSTEAIKKMAGDIKLGNFLVDEKEWKNRLQLVLENKFVQ